MATCGYTRPVARLADRRRRDRACPQRGRERLRPRQSRRV